MGPALTDEQPAAPDAAFAARVAARRDRSGVGEEAAVLHEALLDLAEPSAPTAALLEGRLSGDPAIAAWCEQLAAHLARRKEAT